MELHRLLPLLHDDLPYPVRGVDRAALGLHAGRGKSGEYLQLQQVWQYKVTEETLLLEGFSSSIKLILGE